MLRRYSPCNDSKTLSLTHKGQGNSSLVKNLVPYYLSALVSSKKSAFTLAEGASHGAVFDSNHKIAARIIRGAALCRAKQSSELFCERYYDRHLTSSADAPLYRKFGFTLAEVLITLGIIGVVAALTVPTLIAKYKEKENVAKLKKVYSTLSQAMLFAVEEYGTLDTWGMSQSNVGKNDDGKTILDTTSMGTIADRLAKYTKHTRLAPNWGEGIVETNMQKTPLANNYAQFDRPAAFALDDGTIVMLGQVSNNANCAKSDITQRAICSSAIIWFPDKTKQRIEGVNQFDFYIMKDRLIPWGVPGDAFNPFDTSCKINTNNRNSGRGCTAWVIYNENMDYLHCNDLSWDGKKKCN